MNFAELLYSFNGMAEIKEVEGKWTCGKKSFNTREEALEYLKIELYWINQNHSISEIEQILNCFALEQNIVNDKYDIIGAIYGIFDRNKKDHIQMVGHNLTKKSAKEYHPLDSLPITAYSLIHSIRNKDLEVLDVLLKYANKQIAFAAYIRLCNLLRGNCILTHSASNSEFWGIVNRGLINDEIFLSFHIVNYLNHIDEDQMMNSKNVLSMTKFCHFYEEEKVQETRAFVKSLINKLIEITNTGYFDEEILNLYKQMNSLCEENPKEWKFEHKVEEKIFADASGPHAPLYQQRYYSII